MGFSTPLRGFIRRNYFTRNSTDLVRCSFPSLANTLETKFFNLFFKVEKYKKTIDNEGNEDRTKSVK